MEKLLETRVEDMVACGREPQNVKKLKELQRKVKLSHLAITGECGEGKNTIFNALRNRVASCKVGDRYTE